MSKEKQVQFATVVVEALQERLSEVVEAAIRAGEEVTDRSLLTGIATVFMESMALTVSPDKWDLYLDSLMSDTTRRELTKLRENSERTLDAAKALMGIDNDDEFMEAVKSKVVGKTSRPLN